MKTVNQTLLNNCQETQILFPFSIIEQIELEMNLYIENIRETGEIN
jgi:hypothetical protein